MRPGSRRLAERVAVGEIGSPGTPLRVELLVASELVAIERGALIALVVIQPRIVAAEDSVLHRAVGRPERRQAVLLLQLLGDLEPPQRLDLPLRRAGPARV